MERIAEDVPDQPFDAVAAKHAVQSVQRQMAGRLRSPWWFHVIRGLAVGAVVFGVAERTWWGAAVLSCGLVAYLILDRRRVQTIGFSRSNPGRWRFVRYGAPWSVLALLIVIAGFAVTGLDRSLSPTAVALIAGLVALVTIALGPVSDRAAREYLAREMTL